MDTNNGFIFNNSSFSATNQAVGPNARIDVHGDSSASFSAGDREMLSRLFDLLITRLTTEGATVEKKEDTLATVTSMKAEVQKENPDKPALKGWGQKILDNLKYVKDLAPIAGTIWTHLAPLL